MATRRIFLVLLRKWWLILILTILGSGLGYLNAYFTKPLYEASAKMYIKSIDSMTENISISNFMLSQYLVQQYSQIISSRTVAAEIMAELKEYSITAQQLPSIIQIITKEDSNIFTVKATHTDPVVAAAVANSTALQFSIQLNKITKSDTVGILDEALVPYHSLPDYRTIKIIFGMMVGFMIAAGIIWIVEYFNNRIRSAEDIEDALELHVIGFIPDHDIR